MTIAEIKQQLTIGQVLDHYDIKPNKNPSTGNTVSLSSSSGQAIMLNCPFHDDKKPSLQVYPKTNTYHCFGCGKTGDVIQFIQDKENCTKHQALKKAALLVGQGVVQEVKNRPTMQPDYQKLFIRLRQTFVKSKKAIAYMQSRNLNDIKLEIGYNHYKTGYKQLQNCVVFPLKNPNGKIVSLYGRSLAKGHYYTANRKGLYPAYPAADTQTLILTESIIDAATLLKHTNYQPLALYGTNGLTGEHLEALRALENLQEVILFFDGDPAGEKATEKYSQQLNELLPKVQISQVKTPEGDDPNSLIQSHEPEILDHLIENRTILFSSVTNTSMKKKMPAVAHHLNTKNPEFMTYLPNRQAGESGVLLISILGGIATHPVDKLKVTLKIQRKDSNSPLHSIRHSLDFIP